jgi:hypothetical protein
MSLIGSTLTKASGVAISLPQNIGFKSAKPMTGKNAPKKMHLLCCAPSNAACDEIVRRLKQGVIDGNGKRIAPKVVRLGSSDAIHADVKDVTLDLLVEESFTSGADYERLMKKSSITNAREKELRDALNELNDEREAFRKDENEASTNGDSKVLAEIDVKMRINYQKRKEILEKLTLERDKKTENTKTLETAKKKARARILEDSDVV